MTANQLYSAFCKPKLAELLSVLKLNIECTAASGNLIVFFRSFKLGLIGILANALPLAITLGVMGWFGIKINMATAIIGGISLGIVVDDTIHFINGFHTRLN